MELEIRLLPHFLLSSAGVAVASFVLYRKFRIPAFQPRGQKLGVETSNLEDEFSYGTEETGVCRIKSLWVYPLKSCRGVELSEVAVKPTGFEYDREFMLAEYTTHPKTGEQSWTFLTQRKYPKMALITTALHIDAKHPTNNTLSISFPAQHSFPLSLFLRSKTHAFHIPLAPTTLPLTPVKIWNDILPAHDLSPLYTHDLTLLSHFLSAREPITLFRAAPSFLRNIYRCAPPASTLGYQPVVSFADAYPLHILNLSSVRDVNAHVSSTIPRLSVRRFRGNIIVSGPAAFDEDDWKQFAVGGEEYHAVCRTVRCKLPNVDPDTGERDVNEPDRSLRGYRSIDAGCVGYACLGMQVVPAGTEGVMRVGDVVEVRERGEHLYIRQ